MSRVITFGAGGYRYVEGVFQYSAGVAAEPGFEIARMRGIRRITQRCSHGQFLIKAWQLRLPTRQAAA